MNVSEKNVVITGASRGIGRALAVEFAKKGAHLILVARQFSPTLEMELTALGASSVSLWKIDLSQADEIDNFVKALRTSEFAIDVLVNNAGLLTGGLLEEQDPDAIDKMLEVNLHALIRLTRLILPDMLRRRSGCIVNNASVTGKMFFPCASTYAASKAAVIAFTESLKQELRGTGVQTVLMITPGVKTEMFDDIAHLYGKNLDVSVLDHIPASRWAQKVLQAIQEDHGTVLPSGMTRWGLRLAQHLPSLFETVVRSRFKRNS